MKIKIISRSSTYVKFRDLKPGAVYNHGDTIPYAELFMKLNEHGLEKSIRDSSNILTSGSCICLNNGTLKYTSYDSDCYEYEVNIVAGKKGE